MKPRIAELIAIVTEGAPGPLGSLSQAARRVARVQDKAHAMAVRWRRTPLRTRARMLREAADRVVKTNTGR